MQLKNRIAIVSGASKGLGKAIAVALVKKGVTVYGLARIEKHLMKVWEEVGERFIPSTLDITNQNSVNKWIYTTFTTANSPDIIINNAAIGSFGKIDEMASNEWLAILQTNINGMYFLTKAVVPLLKNKKHTTHIINIGSILKHNMRFMFWRRFIYKLWYLVS